MTDLFRILVPALFAIAVVGLWISAIPMAYRIEALKAAPATPPRGRYADMVSAAFGAATTPEIAEVRTRLRRRLLIMLGVVVVGGLAGYLVRLPASDPPAQQAAHATHATGTTLHYTRSNQDGSKPERILVHIVSPTELAIAKMVAPCTDAALVTAVFDPATGEATRLVGGRLQRDGTQLPQAFLDLDAAARRLDIRFGDPASAPAETLPAPATPWRMYDFDLAEFALFGPREAKDFAFGLSIAWPDGPPPLVRDLGRVDAAFVTADLRDATAVNRFRVSGAPFASGHGDIGGELALDATHGHAVEARFSRPNHSGYTDFLLKLDSIVAGEDAWRAELAKHWANCPA